MQKIFNLTSTFKSVEAAEDGSVNIKGYASPNDTDRAGDVIFIETLPVKPKTKKITNN